MRYDPTPTGKSTGYTDGDPFRDVQLSTPEDVADGPKLTDVEIVLLDRATGDVPKEPSGVVRFNFRQEREVRLKGTSESEEESSKQAVEQTRAVVRILEGLGSDARRREEYIEHRIEDEVERVFPVVDNPRTGRTAALTTRGKIPTTESFASAESIHTLSGVCHFSLPTALGVTADGTVPLVDRRHTPLLTDKIKRILLPDRPTEYLTEMAHRLGSAADTLLAAGDGGRPVIFHTHIPYGEYILYLSRPAQNGFVGIGAMREWTEGLSRGCDLANSVLQEHFLRPFQGKEDRVTMRQESPLIMLEHFFISSLDEARTDADLRTIMDELSSSDVAEVGGRLHVRHSRIAEILCEDEKGIGGNVYSGLWRHLFEQAAAPLKTSDGTPKSSLDPRTHRAVREVLSGDLTGLADLSYRVALLQTARDAKTSAGLAFQLDCPNEQPIFEGVQKLLEKDKILRADVVTPFGVYPHWKVLVGEMSGNDDFLAEPLYRSMTRCPVTTASLIASRY